MNCAEKRIAPMVNPYFLLIENNNKFEREKDVEDAQ